MIPAGKRQQQRPSFSLVLDQAHAYYLNVALKMSVDNAKFRTRTFSDKNIRKFRLKI